MKLCTVVLSLFISSVLLADVCEKKPIYKCSEVTLLDSKCALIQKNDNGYIYHLSQCGSSETCAVYSGTYGYCQKRTPRFAKWEKETCNFKEDCLSDMCDNGKCTALADGADCLLKPNSCSNKSFCNSEKKCQALIKENQDCKSSGDCDFPLICGKKAAEDNPKCIKMFSIATGSYTTTSLLCVSGFSEVKKADNIRYCAESTSTVDKCTNSDNSECVQSIKFSDSDKQEAKGVCACSALGKQGYCALTTDKDEWKNYISIYKSFLSNSFAETDCIRELRKSSWGNLQLAQAAVNVDRYQEFKEADKCAIRALTGSNTIQYSLLMLLSLILVIA